MAAALWPVTVMRVGAGDYCARCPYCGSPDFAAEDADAVAPPQELICARCGGYASRKLLLDEIKSASPDSPAFGPE
jgi:hypothetical protein